MTSVPRPPPLLHRPSQFPAPVKQSGKVFGWGKERKGGERDGKGKRVLVNPLPPPVIYPSPIVPVPEPGI